MTQKEWQKLRVGLSLLTEQERAMLLAYVEATDYGRKEVSNPSEGNTTEKQQRAL